MGGTDLAASDERPGLMLPASLRRVDMPALCDHARDLMEGRLGQPLECDVAEVTDPDLGTIDALARVDLIARRLGGAVRLRGASVELLELLAFCGIPLPSVVETEGQAEEREEPGGVQEEGDPGDPVPR